MAFGNAQFTVGARQCECTAYLRLADHARLSSRGATQKKARGPNSGEFFSSTITHPTGKRRPHRHPAFCNPVVMTTGSVHRRRRSCEHRTSSPAQTLQRRRTEREIESKRTNGAFVCCCPCMVERQVATSCHRPLGARRVVWASNKNSERALGRDTTTSIFTLCAEHFYSLCCQGGMVGVRMSTPKWPTHGLRVRVDTAFGDPLFFLVDPL